jgi:hypothetical protein
MIQLCATRYSCIATLWVSVICFAAITLYVASQRVIPKVRLYFVIDSVWKLLGTHFFCALQFRSLRFSFHLNGEQHRLPSILFHEARNHITLHLQWTNFRQHFNVSEHASQSARYPHSNGLTSLATYAWRTRYFPPSLPPSWRVPVIHVTFEESVLHS